MLLCKESHIPGSFRIRLAASAVIQPRFHAPTWRNA
jgi:hypothetical protein